ncbi:MULTISPECIES: acyl carrier protein [Paenibacillus]|uniref:acyl carrier protein n=1 Tax=Paenibacillus TaxID=44249 RepID=UPI0009D79694|nr:acyl carrier protein [Paenibacillus odorifer]
MMTIEEFKELFEADIVMVSKGEVNDETVLQDLLDWDSLAYIALDAALDEHFGFTLTTDELLGLKTFGDILQYIKKSV